jgi:hypothetical protein
MKRLAKHAVIIAILSAGGMARAAGGDAQEDRRPPADPVVQAAQARFAARDWTGGRELLAKAVAQSPQNPDYHNLYAYAIRKGPSPAMDLVFRHYNEALRLEPKHRGAHEYIGEAYLMTGNVGKAKEHLAQLDKICFFGCEEFTMLKKAIAEHEAKK